MTEEERKLLLLTLYLLISGSLASPVRRSDNEDKLNASKILESESDKCLNSAININGERDPNSELDHYLSCLASKIQRQKDSESLEMTKTLQEVLNSPLFNEQGNRIEKRNAPQTPELDEEMIKVLAKNPEALKFLSGFLKKDKKEPTVLIRHTRPKSVYKPKKRDSIKKKSSPFRNFFGIPKPPKNYNNPLIKGDVEPNMEFFGLSDFKPSSNYKLPNFEHSLPKVLPWQIGYVPIPRR